MYPYDEEYPDQNQNALSGLNPAFANSLYGSLQSSDGEQAGTMNINSAYNANAMQDVTSTMFADTPVSTGYEHGVPTPTGQNVDLAMSGHDASIADLKSRQATAQQNALDMLQKALNNQPEISSSQGIAAALLAAIPAIGGGLIGKMVGSPKIPAGTYFPGMSAQAFNQEFGVGGKAAAAEGAQIGGAAALDYLNRVQKDQVAKTPILEKMAGLYSQQANTLEGRLASAEQNKINAQDRNAAREDQQRFLEGIQGRKPLPENQLESEQLKDPAVRAAFERSVRGEDRPGDEEILPLGLRKTAVSLRSKEAYVAGQADLAANRADARSERDKGRFISDQVEVIPGAAPKEEAINKTREALSYYNRIKEDTLPNLRKAFASGSINEKISATADATIELKKLYNMGASFTTLEQALVDAGFPKFLQLKAGSIKDYIIANLQGQDTDAMFNRLEEKIDNTTKAGLEAYSYRFKPKGGVGSSSSSSGQSSSSGMENLSDDQLRAIIAQGGSSSGR